MAEINLLGTDRQQQQKRKNFGSLITAIFVILLVLLFAFYGYLLLRGRQLGTDTTELQAQIAQAEQDIRNNSEKNQLFTRQAQLADLQKLLRDHLNWSRIVPELSRVTLRSTAYTDFSSEDDGTIVMTLDAPNFVELDKFLQVFDLPQYAQNVSDVRIRSISKAQEDDSLRLRAKIEFTYNKDSLTTQTATK